MTQQIIVITGTPGVGKTAISKALAKRLKGRHINISELALREHLVIGQDPKRDTVLADISLLFKRLQKIIEKTSQTIILDGHYLTKSFAKIDVSLVVVLRLDPDVLKTRLQARRYEDTKIVENVAAEILDVCLSDALTFFKKNVVTEIDVTNRTFEEITDIIIKTLDGRIHLQIGSVNWLERLENEKRIEEFFPSMNLTDMSVDS